MALTMNPLTFMLGFALLSMVVLAGCIGNDLRREGNGEQAPVVVRELAHGQQSGHTQEERLVFTSQQEWEAFWHAHDDGMAQEGPPEVDFDAERVVAVTMGERPNGCYAIKVPEARLSADAQETWVNVTSRVPGPDEMCTQQIVHPYHFVAIPDDRSEVVFVEHETDTG